MRVCSLSSMVTGSEGDGAQLRGLVPAEGEGQLGSEPGAEEGLAGAAEQGERALQVGLDLALEIRADSRDDGVVLLQIGERELVAPSRAAQWQIDRRHDCPRRPGGDGRVHARAPGAAIGTGDEDQRVRSGALGLCQSAAHPVAAR